VPHIGVVEGEGRARGILRRLVARLAQGPPRRTVSRMSQFSDHDPNGQAIRAASGLTHYDRTGWRRWLVPTALAVIVIAGVALAIALIST
jgi:hypothetical protein